MHEDTTAPDGPAAPAPRLVPADRTGEYEGLRTFLLENASVAGDETEAWASAIASAALEPVHLFQALGLSSRDVLSGVMRTRFEPLFLGNDKNMRWKKYLYKRLCGWEGFHQ